MGSRKIRIFWLGIFMMILLVACKKEEEGYPTFPLSENAKGWFSGVQNGYVSFRSSNGLSEGYKLEIQRYDILATFNDKQGLGEECRLSMDANLGNQDFSFKLSNADNPEHIEIGYYNWSKNTGAYHWYLTEYPYKLIRYTSSSGGICLGLVYIGDKVINGKKYQDVFINYSKNNPINEIYLSKSKGLLGYKTQDSIFWYKE